MTTLDTTTLSCCNALRIDRLLQPPGLSIELMWLAARQAHASALDDFNHARSAWLLIWCGRQECIEEQIEPFAPDWALHIP